MAFVCALFTVYYFVLLARVILSFVTAFGTVPPGLAPLVRVVYELTEPIMAPLRRVVPPIGGFDFSILFIFIGLRLAERALGCG